MLRDMLRQRPFRSVTPVLPVETFFACIAPAFRLGLPFPWENFPLEMLVTDPSNPPLLALHAPRTDGLNPLITVYFATNRPDVTTADIRPLLHDLESSYQGRVKGVRKVLLGGVPAVIPVVEGPRLLVQYLMVNSGPGCVEAVLQLPTSHAAAYLPHVETLLGTWAWGP